MIEDSNSVRPYISPYSTIEELLRDFPTGSRAVRRGRLAQFAAVAAAGVLLARHAVALPDQAEIATGSADISTLGDTMTIQQSSGNVLINWGSFNIESAETVNFLQPTSSALAVNRVIGGSPSEILGALNGNGRVILINQNGILFGTGATVNLNSLVATTIDIDPNSISSGHLVFNGSANPTASVINQGSIGVADGGIAALVGAGVDNSGVISAHLGTVSLASGTQFTLDLSGDGLIQLAAGATQTPQDQNGTVLAALASNSGLIAADGGTVLIEARAAAGVLDNVVNMSGIVRAQSVGTQDGRVVLMGNGASFGSGRVDVSGTIDVSGSDAGEIGGSADIFGRYVYLTGANIDLSGDAGSGTALIGGNLANPHGADPLAIGTFVSNDTAIVTNPGDQANASIFGYVVSLEGTMPLHISSGHDGNLSPAFIPSRTQGNMGRDTYTNAFGLEFSQAMFDQFGVRPYFIYNNLHREKLDVNRPLNSPDNSTVQAGSLAAEIFETFHSYNEQANQSIEAAYGSGFYLDIHGYNSTNDPNPAPALPEIIWGYDAKLSDLIAGDVAFPDGLSIKHLYEVLHAQDPSITYMDIIRGPNSLPTLMALAGYPGTPSQSTPIPYATDAGYLPPQAVIAHYYQGGYNLDLYGSQLGGTIDGVQMELPQYLRLNAANRQEYADDLADAMGTFFQANYGTDLANLPAVGGGNAPPPADGGNLPPVGDDPGDSYDDDGESVAVEPDSGSGGISSAALAITRDFDADTCILEKRPKRPLFRIGKADELAAVDAQEAARSSTCRLLGAPVSEDPL